MPENPEEAPQLESIGAADALKAVFNKPASPFLLPPPEEAAAQVASNVERVVNIPDPIAVFDVNVQFSTDGKPVGFVARRGQRALNVNVKRFSSEAKAVRAGVMQALYVSGLRETIAQEGKSALNVAKESPKIARQVQIMRGLQKLKIWDPNLAGKLAESEIKDLTYTAQFDYACHQFLLTGKTPEGLSEEVQVAFAKLSKYGANALQFIAEEDRRLENAIELYKEHVSPARRDLLKLQKERGETEGDDYEPPAGAGERQEVDPESVRFKVYPPLSGYYRQSVDSYDPAQFKVVSLPTSKYSFNPTDLPEELDDLKKYKLEGTFILGGDNSIPLPEKAVPLPATLEPNDKFMITRDTRGVFYIEPKEGVQVEAEEEFSFTFILHKCEDNAINDQPMELDLKTLDGPRGEKSREFLDLLKENKFLRPRDRANAIIAFIKKTFKYPEDEEMEEMNERYRAAQIQLQLAIDDHGITDCHWSNIYASLAGRLFGIPWRNAGGFTGKKIKDIDFTPLGGTGHMWSEVWDEETGQWYRLDATPAKDKNDEDEEEEQQETNEAGEGEEDNEIDEEAELDEIDGGEALELDEEQIAKLMEDVDDAEPGVFEIAEAMLRERTEVDPEQWRRVRDFINKVNAIQIAPEGQIPEDSKLMSIFPGRITAPKGTLEREWQKLFCHIVKRRLMPRRAFKGPVSQSEGVALMDPVMAVTDILAGVDDPMGFKTEAQRTQVKLDINEFEEDALVDLTSSMDDCDAYGNVMKVEQKKMIMGMLHALMRLNEKLNDSRVKNQLREPVTIRSEIFSIHGGNYKNTGKFACLKKREEVITEKVLVNLFRELDSTTPGSGDMLSALRTYRNNITPEQLAKIKAGKLTKMLTIYSDGNMWCSWCGCESCNVQMHRGKIQAIRQEVIELRKLGIIVQGIGFTHKAQSIGVICRDEGDPDAAVVLRDVSQAVKARQRMIKKHLQKV